MTIEKMKPFVKYPGGKTKEIPIVLERGVVVCESVDPAVYGLPEDSHYLFGPESFHNCDYGLYYMNLHENARARITAFNQ